MSAVVAESQHHGGVDVAELFTTLDAVKAQPEAATFRFSVDNRWISGTHNRNEISAFYGVGAEQQHESTFAIEADHPAVLVGQDTAPTPAEIQLAACLTSGLGNIASVRKINLESVESRVEGDIGLRGILGLSDEVRNGFGQIWSAPGCAATRRPSSCAGWRPGPGSPRPSAAPTAPPARSPLQDGMCRRNGPAAAAMAGVPYRWPEC